MIWTSAFSLSSWKILITLCLLLFLYLPVQSQTPSKSCKVIPLKNRAVIGAGAIFSGSVLSFLVPRRSSGRKHPGGKYRDRNAGRPRIFGAKVIVKRVFRGDKDRLQGKEVIVEGLGNPKICVSRPRLGDTRLFFTDPLGRAEFAFPGSGIAEHVRLKSSLLRLTLPNLKVLWKMERGSRKNQSHNDPGKEITITWPNIS